MGDRCQLTMRSTHGAQVDTKQEKAEFAYANLATESGRRTTSLTTCTEIQFHFHWKGLPKESRPKVVIVYL